MQLHAIITENGQTKTIALKNVSYYVVDSDDSDTVLSVGFTYGDKKDPYTIISHAGEKKFDVVLDKLTQRGLPLYTNSKK